MTGRESQRWMRRNNFDQSFLAEEGSFLVPVDSWTPPNFIQPDGSSRICQPVLQPHRVQIQAHTGALVYVQAQKGSVHRTSGDCK